ncbi:hypothetical protein H1R20_g16156, partial [Candolleomyces eurysporus]
MSGAAGAGEHDDPFLAASLASGNSIQGSRTNATLQARRLANRLSLGPYTRELESFAVEDNGNQALLLFAKILAIEQKVANIAPPSTSFTVGKALMDNIKSYVLAVLLSPKLSTYKGRTPAIRVMAVIKHLNINVPANLETDRHVYKSIKESVTTELTQTRSKIKKARKVHAEPEKSDQKYWNHVDERLALIREIAEGDEDKIQQAFSGVLAKDRQLYGTASQQAVQLQASTSWQTTVDDLMANTSAATNSPGGSTQDDDADDDDT